MIDKMIRAARLETSLFNQVEQDQNETSNALLVVLIVALVSGLGAALSGANVFGAFIGATITAVLGWAVWAFMIYLVGTRVFNATATVGELLRTQGYAQSPGVLAILGGLPLIGGLIGLIVFIWQLAASFIATREALDLDNTKTAVTVLLGVLGFIIVAMLMGLIVGGTFGLFGALTGR